jgi:uncharacterized protein with von Willebrand factor type A (vWA) domain
MTRYRYGPYREGPDPLAPPYDVREALDAVGEDVLEGMSASEALRDLLRRGLGGERPRQGLDDLLRQVRERRRELRERGRLDGTLEEARALLDTAIGQERAELFPDPSDDARLREATLDMLPSDTARAITQLRDYQWRSEAARQTFERLKNLLRSEVLDAQFEGLKQALQGGDPEQLARVKDMMAALNAMLDADARGEHTQADFDAFMDSFGEFFPDSPRTLEELGGDGTAAQLAQPRAAPGARGADGPGHGGRRSRHGDVAAVQRPAQPPAGPQLVRAGGHAGR